MIHEKYTGKIKDYVNGIDHDLESVIPKEGHDLVKVSISEQAKRLADIATSNNEFFESMADEFFTMIENRWDVVKIEDYDIEEYNMWHRVEHEQLMKDFRTYLRWGLDAVDHFDDLE